MVMKLLQLMRLNGLKGGCALMLAFGMFIPSALAQLQPIPTKATPISPLSPESQVNNPQSFAQFSPYNNGFIELDLWRLEEKRFVRSRPVFSPDKQWMAYSEVFYSPDIRETTSKVYVAPLSELPPKGTLAPTPTFYENRIDPTQYLKNRLVVVGNGFEKAIPFGFRTYTVVDWSATGNRLLVKEKNGVTHVGLRASDVLVYDRQKAQVLRYPEIKRGIEHYWASQTKPLNLDEAVWDIYPLGWEPGSDQMVLVKAWLFQKTGKQFLGVWRLDVDAERPELVSLQDQVLPVAANGAVAKIDLKGYPPPKKQRKNKKQKTPANTRLTQ